MSSAFKKESDTDYVLREGWNRVWITVDKLSVCIARHDEGIAVDIYALGKEDEDSIAGTWALYSEGEYDADEE